MAGATSAAAAEANADDEARLSPDSVLGVLPPGVLPPPPPLNIKPLTPQRLGGQPLSRPARVQSVLWLAPPPRHRATRPHTASGASSPPHCPPSPRPIPVGPRGGAAPRGCRSRARKGLRRPLVPTAASCFRPAYFRPTSGLPPGACTPRSPPVAHPSAFGNVQASERWSNTWAFRKGRPRRKWPRRKWPRPGWPRRGRGCRRDDSDAFSPTQRSAAVPAPWRRRTAGRA